jgi:hypothetical protein
MRGICCGCSVLQSPEYISTRVGAQALSPSWDIEKYNPALKAFSNRLADANKKSKVIIVAVMRKMITTLNAMLRDNAAWQPQSA